MIWTFHNFNNNPQDIAKIKNGDKFIDCSFVSMVNDQFTLKNKLNLKFLKCNLINVELHPTSETKMCNSAEIRYDINAEGDITGSTPIGKKNHRNLIDDDVEEVLADDKIGDRILWSNYKHEIMRARKKRGKPEIPPRLRKKIEKLTDVKLNAKIRVGR